MSDRTFLSQLLEYLSRPFRLDLRSLALFRVGLGLLMLADIVNRVWYLRAHYTDFGIMPRGVVLDTLWNQDWISLHMANGAMWFQIVLFGVMTLSSICLLIGYKTKWATAITWLLTISLHARNPLVGQGGDIVFRLLLFWGFFLPIGAKYSVDSALDVGGDNADAPESESEPTSVLSISTVAYVAQICFIYFFAYLLKTGEEWHTEFSAVFYALHLDQFTTPLGDFIRQQEFLLPYLTGYTLGLEGFGWLLLLVPIFHRYFRSTAIALFISMHLGFAVCMRLGLFGYISSVAWLALLPPGFWKARFESFKRAGEGLRLEYAERSDRFGLKLARILRTFLILPEASLNPAADTDSTGGTDEAKKDAALVVVDEDEHHSGYDGLVALVDASPLFGAVSGLLTLGWLEAIGRKLWRFTTSRERLAGALEFRAYTVQPGLASEVAAGCALVLCLLWNVQTVPALNYMMPRTLQKATVAFRLDQKWNMFAPYPLKDDGWYVMPAKLEDGTRFDLFQRDPTVDWAKPEDVSATYPSQRWRKYLMNLWMAEHSNQRLYYGKYLCRQWNARHSGKNQLQTFKIYYMKERTTLENPEPKPERTHLWTHYCFRQPSTKSNSSSSDGDDATNKKSGSSKRLSDEALEIIKNLPDEK